MSLVFEHHIDWSDITVDNLIEMQVSQTGDDLKADVYYLVNCEPFLRLQERFQIATVQVLRQQMEAVKSFVVIALVLTDQILVLHQVGMIQMLDQVEFREVRLHHIILNLHTVIYFSKLISEHKSRHVLHNRYLNLPNAPADRPDHFDFDSIRERHHIFGPEDDVVLDTLRTTLPILKH